MTRRIHTPYGPGTILNIVDGYYWKVQLDAPAELIRNCHTHIVLIPPQLTPAKKTLPDRKNPTSESLF